MRRRLEKIAEGEKDRVFDAIAQEVHAENKSLGSKFANENARKRVDEAWTSFEGKLSLVSGKLLLSKVSEWSQERFNVSFGARRIARELRPNEISPEIMQIILAIEERREFPLDNRAPCPKSAA